VWKKKGESTVPGGGGSRERSETRWRKAPAAPTYLLLFSGGIPEIISGISSCSSPLEEKTQPHGREKRERKKEGENRGKKSGD